MKIFVSSVQT